MNMEELFANTRRAFDGLNGKVFVYELADIEKTGSPSFLRFDVNSEEFERCISRYHPQENPKQLKRDFETVCKSIIIERM